MFGAASYFTLRLSTVRSLFVNESSCKVVKQTKGGKLNLQVKHNGTHEAQRTSFGAFYDKCEAAKMLCK